MRAPVRFLAFQAPRYSCKLFADDLAYKEGIAVEPLLLRPADAAKILGLSRGRIYELLAAGEIDSIKVGGARLIPVESLRLWVDRQRSDPVCTSAAEPATQAGRVAAGISTK